MSPGSWYTLELQLLGNTLTGYVEPFQNTLDASSSSATVQTDISPAGFDTVMLAPYANSISMMTSWALVVARAAPPNGVMPTASGTSQIQTSSTPTQGLTTTPTSVPTTTSPTTAPTPVWGFNGAYAVYSNSVSANGYSVGAGSVNYTIYDVNAEAQTFRVSTSTSSQFGGLGTSSSQASFLSPSPFPAVTAADLGALNAGSVPSDLSAVGVTTGVTLKVPAGTYTTDEVSLSSGETMWVDSYSGLIVQITTSSPSNPSSGEATSALSSTNIPSGGTGLSITTYTEIAGVVIVVVVLGGLFALRRRKGKTTTAPPTPTPPITPSQGPTISLQSDQKLQQLKSMLDAGLITQAEYDEQRKRLTGQ